MVLLLDFLNGFPLASGKDQREALPDPAVHICAGSSVFVNERR
jgi:hypothetical protein